MDKRINFLHLNASDLRWGASVSSYRFHKALLEKGFGSHILCGLKESLAFDSSLVIPGKFSYIPNALVGKAFNFFGLQSFGYPSSFFIKRSKLINNWADIVILRNLHWWYLSIGILPWISKKVPLIWRLPDMWPLTGHCSYPYNCNRWLVGCGRCPNLGDYPELYIDTTQFLWKRKKRIYQKLKSKLVFVSPSKWLYTKLKQSPLTCDFHCEIIPTAIDLNTFKPENKKEVRKTLGIRDDERVVMFSAFKISDKRKGASDIINIINNLSKQISFPLTVLCLGHTKSDMPFSKKIKVVNAGFIRDDRAIASYYNAADLYISMSKADNLPNTLVEASACGIPIVTLDRGGCKETLINNESGYLIENRKEAEQAILKLLTDTEKQKSFSSKAREFAEKKFSMDLQVKRYNELAKRLINERT